MHLRPEDLENIAQFESKVTATEMTKWKIPQRTDLSHSKKRSLVALLKRFGNDVPNLSISFQTKKSSVHYYKCETAEMLYEFDLQGYFAPIILCA